ncbi:hypothetical protein NW757_003160 [Fusarium falciforme]|nr:hypothetical protein NW757_003160 [Fusarium falciforme]
MPRMPGLALNHHIAYQRYLESEPGNPGNVKRWSGLRPFERDEQGRISLPMEIDDTTNYYTLLVARLTGADDDEGEIATPRNASGEIVAV